MNDFSLKSLIACVNIFDFYNLPVYVKGNRNGSSIVMETKIETNNKKK